MPNAPAETTAPEDLPIYPIRTVAQLSGVDARRLRSWEAEYQLLRPARTRGGHRLYSARDLELIREIRRLVDEEGMSLQGIRAWLAARSDGVPSGSSADANGRPPAAAGQVSGAGQATASEPADAPVRPRAALPSRQ